MLIEIIISVLIIINVVGFSIMGVDKHKARKRKWRIPEKAFFIISLLGGSPGTFAGMLAFRHKTRHWYFMLGIPAIFIAEAVAAYLLTRIL